MVFSDLNPADGALPSRWPGHPVLRAYGTMLLFGPAAVGLLRAALRSPQGGHVATFQPQIVSGSAYVF